MSARLTDFVFDPFELARAQLMRDVETTRPLAGLFEVKRAKLCHDVHAFLRGTVELFYTMVAADPSLMPGPSERGFVAGDMHAENLGVYRTESKVAAFDLDDFDDASVAPLRVDVVRASTSIMLASLQLDPSVDEAIAATRELVASYVRGRVEPSQRGRRKLPPRIAERLRTAEDEQLRRRRVEKRRGHYRYVRNDRYVDLPEPLVEAAPRLLHLYVGALGERAPKHAEQYVLEDAAWRIAGNGSLGMRRIAYVLRRDRRLHLVELKEARASALELLGATEGAWPHHAARVVAAANALPATPARGLAAVHDATDGASYVGRWLTPQLDRVEVLRDAGRRLSDYARLLGQRLAAAHVRGRAAAIEQGRVDADEAGGWDEPDTSERVLDAAVRLAGLHRAVHLAYVRLAPAFDPRA
jgi:uncharacterized protein (DUF2252 family)